MSNTQLLQAVCATPAWVGRLTEEDRRGLSPLSWSHVNPCGRFRPRPALTATAGSTPGDLRRARLVLAAALHAAAVMGYEHVHVMYITQGYRWLACRMARAFTSAP